MPSIKACNAEVESLHEFFVDWFCGNVEEDAIETMEQALAPSFEIITPGGDILGKEAIIGFVKESYDSYDDGEFTIEIRNVEPVEMFDDRGLVRYEEYRETPDGSNFRRSTALFAPARWAAADDQSVEWRFLHETWGEE